MGAIRLAIADDHTMIREALGGVLESGNDVRVVKLSSYGADLFAWLSGAGVDVILLDVQSPRSVAFDAADRIAVARPEVKIVINDDVRSAPTLLAGKGTIRGWVCKFDGLERLRQAIRAVATGGVYMTSAPMDADGKGEVRNKLTPREEQVLRLIAEGLSNKEISVALKKSVKTVDNHRQAIMRRLGIHSVAELTRYAIRERLVIP